MYEELIDRLRTYANDGTDEMRNEAANAIEHLADENTRLVTTVNELSKMYDKLVDEMPDGWIPVTERLPEWGHYFVFVKAGEYDDISWTQVAYFDGKKFHGVDATATAVVTHWMPLPEPPKEEN